FGIWLLEGLIFLTGNYTFFNLLTMALCVVLFDDAALRKVVPQRLTRYVQGHVRVIKPGKIASFPAEAFALLIVFANIVQIHAALGGRPSALAMWTNEEIAPLRIVNTYGLFAVMTTTRPE